VDSVRPWPEQGMAARRASAMNPTGTRPPVTGHEAGQLGQLPLELSVCAAASMIVVYDGPGVGRVVGWETATVVIL
jgi:hypothetical protein